MMYRLESSIMNYDWGSHTAIASLMRRSVPSADPEAELWVGSHPRAPSRVLADGRRVPLDQVIRDEPARMLGDDCAECFGGRLPFMLKAIAPHRPLSIQCHPTTAQVRTARPDTYADDWPKPEAILAVSRFEIFAGLKTFAQMRRVAAELGLGALEPHLRRAADDGSPVHALLTSMLHLSDERRRELVRECVDACRARAADRHDPVAAVIARHADTFPDDIGLVVLLLMQHHVLEPGTYASVPAGLLHAYVGGLGVEILANSDNVVRAGLTHKKIDVEELLRIVRVDEAAAPTSPARDGRICTYPVTTPHFRLSSIDRGTTGQSLPGPGLPRLGLAIDGDVELTSPDDTLELSSGQSCFIPADTGPVSVRGDGRLALGCPGSAEHAQSRPGQRSPLEGQVLQAMPVNR